MLKQETSQDPGGELSLLKRPNVIKLLEPIVAQSVTGDLGPNGLSHRFLRSTRDISRRGLSRSPGHLREAKYWPRPYLTRKALQPWTGNWFRARH